MDPEFFSQEEITDAREMSTIGLHNFKQHSVGINALRKLYSWTKLQMAQFV